MTEITQVKLDEMLAGLEGVTPGPRHMYVSPTDILVTDDAGNNIAHFLPMDEDSNADFVNATAFARFTPDTMRALIALASQALRSQGEAVAWRYSSGWVTGSDMVKVWLHTSDPDLAKREADSGNAVEPLYTHPAPQEAGEVKVTDEMVERVALAMHDSRREVDSMWSPWEDMPENYKQNSLEMVRVGLSTLTEGSSR